MVVEPLEELNAEETLDAFEAWHAERIDREIRQFVAAAHFADLHNGDARGTGGRVLPGMEQAKRLGGPGTPAVMEFAAAELGARMSRSPYAGRALMADALDVRHRLPRLWGRVRAGEVLVSYARFVAQQTRELSQAAATIVDAAVAEYADGRLTWSRFETLVAAKVVAADPERAAERERRAAEEEFAKVGRSNEHGQRTLYVKSSAAAMVRVDTTIDYLARALAALGDTDDEDRRRAKAILIMANPVQAVRLLQAFASHRAAEPQEKDPGDPLTDGTDDTDDAEDTDESSGRFVAPFRPSNAPDLPAAFRLDQRALLPTVTCYVHLAQDAITRDAGGVARWEGAGPVTTAYVRDFLGPHCNFIIKPVIDMANLAPVDAYEIPDRHREAVHLRSPADVFPFASNTGRRRQLDHTEPYLPPDDGGPPGQTGVDNLGPLVQFHHRIKTFGAWQVKQPFSGIFIWRDPHGRYYLVDHTGTRKLGKAEPTDPAPTDPAPADVTVEVYAGLREIEYQHPDRHAA